VVLPDAMVSRRHAVIEYRGSQYFLRDCNSSNGSVINGDRVSEKSLRDGDLVAIGSARLLFREERDLEQIGSKVVQHPSAPRLACPGCQADYRKGDVFCKACGEKLPEPGGPPKAVCASCGTAIVLPARFCSACGTKLPETEAPAPAAAAPEPATAVPGSAAVPLPVERGSAPEPAQEGVRTPPDPAAATDSGPALPAPKSGPLAPASGGGRLEAVRAPSRPVAAPPRPDAEMRSLSGARRAAAPALRTEPIELVPAPATEPQHRPGRAPAPAGLRALAFGADLVAVGLLQLLVLAPMAAFWWSRELPARLEAAPMLPLALSALGALAAAAAGVAYYALSWGRRGATWGQRLLGLEVTSRDGQRPIGVGQATVRVFGYLLSAVSLGVGFLMVPLTGFGLHDRLAGTRVVLRQRRP
jgi:uncharacterized RDD family membrane protein YckC